MKRIDIIERAELQLKKSKFHDLLIKFVKFGLVGVLNTIISQIIYMLLISIGQHYIIASVAGFIVSVFHAFLWQYNIIFKENDTEREVWWKALFKTYTAYAFTGLLLSNLLLIMWIDLLNLEQYTEKLTAFVNSFGLNFTNAEFAADIAPLLNMVIYIPINFFLNNFWAYRKKK